MLEGLFRESHSSSAALGSVQMSPSNHAVRDWSASPVHVDVKNAVFTREQRKHRVMGK